MAYHPTQFSIALKNARTAKKLTQAELAETLDISLPYLKDLERSRNNPSYKTFERIIRYFNLSADAIIYSDAEQSGETCQKLVQLLPRCNKRQLSILLAVAEALLSANE